MVIKCGKMNKYDMCNQLYLMSLNIIAEYRGVSSSETRIKWYFGGKHTSMRLWPSKRVLYQVVFAKPLFSCQSVTNK